MQAIKLKASKLPDKQINLRDARFIAQNAAIDDESRFRAWQCTRRAGKSTGAGADMLETAQKHKGTRQLFFGLTPGSAKDILWDYLLETCEKNKIKHKVNVAELSLTFTDWGNSKIQLVGADASRKEIRKKLGQKLKKVFIDEAGSYSIDLGMMVKQMLRPALADLRGQLTLLGTPENIPNTYFQKVMEGKDDITWSTHKWTAYDNPFMKEAWKLEIDEILSGNPNVINASWYKTHYLNEWCSDDNLLIYKFKQINFTQSLPDRDGWNYVLSLDLGFNDDTSFVVGAYHEFEKNLFILEAYKKPEMIFSEVAKVIMNYQSRFPINKIIVDGANKQGVQELVRRYGLPLHNADKTDKNTFIRMLADDVLIGVVQIMPDATAIVSEASSLQWKDELKDKEDPRCANHLCDALLYLHRFSYNYLHKDQPKPKDYHDEKTIDEFWEKEADRIRREQSLSDY